MATLEDLNQQIAGFEERELNRRIGSRIRTIGQDFAREAPHLLPLPREPFETAMALTSIRSSGSHSCRTPRSLR
ncbi:hypothetical protein ACPC39_33415 [Streptomyces cellulosae]